MRENVCGVIAAFEHRCLRHTGEVVYMATTHHNLPGEVSNSEWFDRLNSFEQQETCGQVAFKRQQWPGIEVGPHSK